MRRKVKAWFIRVVVVVADLGLGFDLGLDIRILLLSYCDDLIFI